MTTGKRQSRAAEPILHAELPRIETRNTYCEWRVCGTLVDRVIEYFRVPISFLVRCFRMNRREAITSMAWGGALALTATGGLKAQSAGGQRLKQGVSYWTYQKWFTLEQL